MYILIYIYIYMKIDPTSELLEAMVQVCTHTYIYIHTCNYIRPVSCSRRWCRCVHTYIYTYIYIHVNGSDL